MKGFGVALYFNASNSKTLICAINKARYLEYKRSPYTEEVARFIYTIYDQNLKPNVSKTL